MVGVCFFCSALSSPGQSFVISLYLDHLMADIGISRVEISTLYAVATLGAAACLPFVGGWSDRVSERRFLSMVLALLGVGLLLLATSRSVLALGFAFFAVRLLGQGAIGLGTLTITVRWFYRYRGRALAVVSLGYAFGEMVFPGLIHLLIRWMGWRGSLALLAGVYLLLLAPMVATVLRKRDSATEPMDGETQRRFSGESHGSQWVEPSYSLPETLRLPAFWSLLACLAIPPLVMTAVIFHQVALFAGNGWDAALVPPAFMAYAVAGIFGTYATGLALERIPSRFGVAASMALIVVAFGSTLLPVGAVAGALLYGGGLGLASGASAAVNSIVWPDYFGVEALGALKGVVNSIRNGATAVGPPLAAMLMEVSRSTGTVLLTFGVAAALAAVAATWIHPPERTYRGEQPSLATVADSD